MAQLGFICYNFSCHLMPRRGLNPRQSVSKLHQSGTFEGRSPDWATAPQLGFELLTTTTYVRLSSASPSLSWSGWPRSWADSFRWRHQGPGWEDARSRKPSSRSASPCRGNSSLKQNKTNALNGSTIEHCSSATVQQCSSSAVLIF